MDLKNKMLSEDEFFKERQEVLAQWPTGKDVDLDEAIAFHKSLPKHKVWVHKLKQAKERGEFYAITGMGTATVEQQLELLTYIDKEGQANLLGTSVDSFSRQNDYKEAERGIRESVEKGRSVLNGFPIVNHGVAGFRRIIQAVNSPISMRYGAADTRLIDEIGYAGGHTAGSTDALMDFWHHHSRIPLETVISTHRYVQRLIGYYEAHGVPLCASCQGLYGAGIPPALQMAAILVQILMIAEQGVKHMRFHIAAHGNLAQDVATANVLRKLAHEYLNQYGYHDVETYLSVSFSLVQYPLEPGAAFAVAFMNTLMTKLCGAQANDIRTVAEAKGIPTKEDTAYTFRSVRIMENLIKAQEIAVDPKALAVEEQIVEQEVRSIFDKVLEFGDGDVVPGTIQAVKSGVMDNPFATNPTSPCKVMGIKDAEGAIRYLNHGHLPFTPEIIGFHKDKIAQREKEKGQRLNYDTLVSDLLAVSKGVLVE
jgi:methylaspartate mutase epsilon subunit